MSRPDEDSEEKTPPAGNQSEPSELPPSFRPTPSQVARPWALDNARSEGTNPGETLKKLKQRARKADDRKPWYAAGGSAILFAVAAAITYTLATSHDASKAVVVAENHHGDLTAKLLQEQVDRLEGEKALHEDLETIKKKLEEISSKLDKKK